MTVPAVAGEMPPGAWLRRQRETRGWTKRDTARRLVQAGKDAGDTAVPGVDAMCRYVHRWERGENGLTERYRMHYCTAFGIPLAGFGSGDDAPAPVTEAGAHGLSVSVQYAPGRLVIEISGLGSEEAEAEPERRLSLVTPQDPPRSYGGRA
ncbi:MAG TPA: helix-turn-helix transcriptional regulator [Streptosporangiaceae bacterium]